VREPAHDGQAPTLARQGWPEDAVETVSRLLSKLADVQRENEQLHTALQTRIVIEQAKGVLVERHSLVPDQAFEALRRGARSTGRRIHDVAAEIVAGTHTPLPVLRHIQAPR